MAHLGARYIAVGVAALVLTALITRVRFGGEPEMTRYSGLQTERYSCSDPKYVNDYSCTSNACRKAVEDSGRVTSPNRTREIKRLTVHEAPEGARIAGAYAAEQGPEAFPETTFTCLVADGKVVSLTIDGSKIAVKAK